VLDQISHYLAGTPQIVYQVCYGRTLKIIPV